ncbi:MAG: hypothetical protein D6819_04220 [Gammaproteobacteria bacterium]|nr:MAG: hypothetical protein D6819_04220 [Gammaproteobacteria bacterium]
MFLALLWTIPQQADPQRPLAKHFAPPTSAAHVIVKARPGGLEALRRSGYAIEAAMGDIASMTVPLRAIEGLASHPEVLALSPVKHYRPTLDKSIPDAGASGLRTRSRDGQFEGITGKGTIVAIVDSGIDWRHPDFRNPDGTTRILYLWDPSDPSFSQSGIGSPPPPGGKGTVYTADQINAALLGLGTVNSEDECGHGSHVAGIAAGNGGGGGGGIPPGTFVGMAPEADIIAVRVFNGDCDFLAKDISLVQAFSFIDQKAQALHEPYVINLSLGTQIGGHDGTDLEELAIDTLVGPGKPGKAVVVSAGNEGGEPVHVGGSFGEGESVSIGMVQNEPESALFDFWFSAKDTFTLTLEGGGKPPEDITDQLTFSPLSGSKRLLLLTDRAPNFTLTITGESVQDGRFDGWTEDGSFQDHLDFSRLVSIPGTARHAITVGAHTTKTQWTDKTGQAWSLILGSLGAPARFTSPGPTRDGRLKPEISAPGQVIASTLSSAAADLFFPDFLILADGKHAISQGTSMSAAHVTGAVALLFERIPGLDAALAREILTLSARTDFHTRPVPNPTTGFGKLDMERALFPEKPRVVLAPDKASLFSGESLSLYFAIQRGKDHNIIDGWVALRLPDGRFLFLAPDGKGFSPEQMPFRSNMEIRNGAGRLFALTVPPSTPPGDYTFFAVGTIPGTDPFDSANWLTNLASATVTVLP